MNIKLRNLKKETISQLDGFDDYDQDCGPSKPKKQKLQKIQKKEEANAQKEFPMQMYFYVGNLRNEEAVAVLKNNFVCLRDSKEDNHTLKPLEVKNLALIKRIKCKTEDGAEENVYSCFKCDPFAEILSKNLSDVQILTQKDIKSMKQKCKQLKY